uniref:Uncharacterized protein n=1 Tax=Nelumbo nucifera TaxID=4432 RepID=A0A822YWX8_NELNU|nr:TPA_asm: hypothetical protein HUJ06_012906 [Nelumbo nucifera]
MKHHTNKSCGWLPPPLCFVVSVLAIYLLLPHLPVWLINNLSTFQGLTNYGRLMSSLATRTSPFSNQLASSGNQHEWRCQLESLATHQIKIIAILCKDDVEVVQTCGTAPMAVLNSSNDVLARNRSFAIWNHPGGTPIVSHTNEASMLPRLVTWQKSEDIASKILFSTNPSDRRNLDNHENQTLFTTHQMLELWIQLLLVIQASLEAFHRVEDLYLFIDPEGFLRLKNQLAVNALIESEAFYFRSKALIEITKSSKYLKQRVPIILGMEVDPKGGPKV